tara:strand:+ start:1421 stop:1783 length:363 start_codon:yes stop_codon:yes gene_type:complete
MSNPTNSFSSPLNDEIVQAIDKLNLPIVQKHHVKLLAHCLEIFKEISKENTSSFEEDLILKEWCKKQSQRFNDKSFNELFYEQMTSAAKKLNDFSLRQGKTFKELELEDLIILVKQNSEN